MAYIAGRLSHIGAAFAALLLAGAAFAGSPGKTSKAGTATPSPEFRKLVANIETSLKCKVTSRESRNSSRVVILLPEEHSDTSDANQAKRLAAIDRACGIDCLLLENVPADPSSLKPAMLRLAELMHIDEPFDHDFGVPGNPVDDSAEEIKTRCDLLRGKGSFPVVGIENPKALVMGNLVSVGAELNKEVVGLWEAGEFDGGKGLPGDKNGPAGSVVQLLNISRELLKLAPDDLRPLVKDIAIDPMQLVLARNAGKTSIQVFFDYLLAWNSYVTLICLQGRNEAWMNEPAVKNALSNPRYKRLALIAGAAHLDKKQLSGATTDLRDMLQKKGVSWILLPMVK